MTPAACDAYTTIGAAMFGDPSGVPDSAATLAAETSDELNEAAATYGDTFVAAFDGDEAAMESPEFVGRRGHRRRCLPDLRQRWRSSP